ncbi:sugar porter family MFS transporter [Aspergillus brunneoviolaceus CBS 621.78]|uniref:General substrate transporter n=2 Tax=Aspergillus TaxID=5052 RepID=A0A8G1RIU7_9EURO|nr:general substrate transporter [Aspergillus brunneoviolaceus CBS 621.78]XP_040797207.1 general substrate transporter [Aspergillus fijiensis CBS 313.89]RAH41053.1 general substrate transporter [Aspergillus brunneoviolaceus CBS 621.78]RAK73197.1 general substrate transporter [Aspergillus fijiensis CBS 313.89]
MALPPKWYQFLVCVFASLGSVLYGYDLGVIAEALTSPSLINAFNADATKRGAVTSVFTGGAFFGAYFAGPLGDYAGRKWTIFVGALIFLLGGGLQTGAQSLSYLYAGRAVAGLGVGILVMIVPIYQAELAHPNIRGRITSLQQLMLGVGSLVASWISWGTFINFADDDSRQWRVSLGIQMVPAVFLAALILLFPESPRWLIDHGRLDEGLATLARLHARGDTSDAWVQAEYEQITVSIAQEHEAEAKSYKELFTDPSCFRRLFLACSIQAAAQMTGVSAIQYFSTTIFEQIGIAANDTLKYQGISSIIAIIAQFCCMMMIDKTGRRWPQIIGNLFNCLFFVIPTILIAKFPPGVSNNTSASWAFIVMTWCYNFSYSATVGPLTWIICAEIFDTKTRSKGVSIATMTSFAFNTMIGQVTDIAIDNIGGWRFYVVFCVCNFTNAIFFWLVLPETALRPLEEMTALFEHEPWLVPGSQTKGFIARRRAGAIMEELEGDEKPGRLTFVHAEGK